MLPPRQLRRRVFRLTVFLFFCYVFYSFFFCIAGDDDMERSIVSISFALVASARRSVVVLLLAKRRLFFLFVDDDDTQDAVLCFSFQGTSRNIVLRLSMILATVKQRTAKIRQKYDERREDNPADGLRGLRCR
jgi:hypothetical protein